MICDESYDSNAKYFQALIKYIPIPSTKHDIKFKFIGLLLISIKIKFLSLNPILLDLHNAFKGE